MPPSGAGRLRGAALAASALGRVESAVRLKARDVEAEAEAAAAQAGASLPEEWLAALRGAMQPDPRDPPLALAVRASLLRCIEQLHEKELRQHAKDMQTQKSKAAFKQGELEKKIGNMRRAGNVEGESQVKILEVKHREELARLQAELDEAQGVCAARLEQQAAVEKRLLTKITLLDGGLAKAQIEHERYIRGLQERAIRRMRNAKMAAGFTTWLAGATELKRMHNAAKRLSNLGTARCFNSWLDSIEEQERMRRMLAGAAGRLARPALAAALAHWRNDWDVARRFALEGGLLGRVRALEEELRLMRQSAEEREIEANERAREASAEQMARTAIRRMRGAQLCGAWERWQQQREKQSVAARALRRMMNARLAAAWNSWVTANEERQEVLRRMRTFGGRLMNRALAVGFGGWVAMCEEAEMRKALMEGSMYRLLNVQLGRALNTWIDQRAMRARREALMREAVARLGNPVLSASFRAWRDDWMDELRKSSPDDLWTVPGLRAALAKLEAALVRSKEAAQEELERFRERAYVEIAQAEDAARVASEEARRREEMLERQEREMSTLRREREALRREGVRQEESLRAELDRARHEIDEACDALRRAFERETRDEREEAARKAAELERTSRLLASETKRANDATEHVQKLQHEIRMSPLPLALQEKRGLVAAMNERMRQLCDAVGAQNSRRIRDLTALVSLRDRQLSAQRGGASGGSPRSAAQLHAMLGTSQSASTFLPKKSSYGSLDTRPLQGVSGRGKTSPAMGGGGATGSGAALLACTPSLAEAEAWAQRLIGAEEEERLALLHQGLAHDADRVLAEHIAGMQRQQSASHERVGEPGQASGGGRRGSSPATSRGPAGRPTSRADTRALVDSQAATWQSPFLEHKRGNSQRVLSHSQSSSSRDLALPALEISAEQRRPFSSGIVRTATSNSRRDGGGGGVWRVAF